MRKIYTRCLFLLICFQCSTAQYNFDKKWKKIEALEIEGKFSSAFKKVERLNRKANETQNTEQIVKSFIYRMKFSLLLTENTEVTLLQTVRNEIDTQNFPTNAILENIYARLLSDYFIKYQYKIRKRSTVASDETPHDIQLWNTARFMQEIHKRFQHSIAQEKALLQLPVEDYMTFLDGKATTKKYRSSLYDILIYNMLDFYKSSSQYRFQIDDSDKLEDLAPTSEFLQRKFTIHNIEEIGYDNTMYLFQKLENIYKDQKEAFVDVVLQRLQFVISKTANHKFDTPYVDALERLAAQFPNDPLEALIRYEIANHYHKISKQHYSKSKETHEKLRVKAMDISNKMIAKYPNSEGAIQCKLLQKQIEYKSIKFRSELYSIPNKASLAQLKTRNVDTIFVKAYKVSQQFARTQSTAKRDSLIGDFLLSAQEEFTKKISTNTPKDYYEHSTEISIPSLPIGRYLIAISNTAEQSKNNVIAFDFIEKTNLTATETEFDNEKMYTILHRTTGKPIPNVKIHVRDAKKTINQTERTNSYGNARVPKRINTTNVTQYITFNKDTLYQANNSLGYRYRNQKKEKGRWVAQPFVLMDRSIYRPGQTAYFKIIVLQEKNNISSVVPNEFFEIEIDAASGQEIKKIRLKTNEFGAISGSFVIPKNAGTGRFSFNVLEYYEYEEDDHPFWDYIDEFYDTYHDFQVEEYKRPRFEVQLEPLNKNIHSNDTVTITGTAKALLGSAISNAKVRYTVERMANIAYYKRAKGKKYPEASIIIDSTTTTDNKGNFNISFVTEIYENLAPEEVYSYQYDIQIEITDNNGETQTATKRILVDNQSFKLSVDVARKNERGVPLALKMYAFDVNRVPVSVTGTVKVYKLKEAARVFRKRPWPAPEKQIISKDQFIAQFPHTNYSREELNRGREEKQIAKTTFALDKKTTVSLDTTTWEPGSYSLESTAYNESFSDSVTVKRTFIITDKSSKYLVNNALFDYEIVNSNYKNDGYVNLKLATALRDETLHVYIQTFYQDQLLKTQIASIEEGSKTIKVPVYKIHTDKYTIRLSYTKFNDFYKDEFSFELYDAYKFLTVKTETFRNRLQPGQQETWRFTILDLEQNPSNAEVLASMYDESLDQFKTHEWKTNISLRENNRQYAPFSRSQYFKTTHSSQFYNVKNEVYIPNFKNYLRFNWFGLNLKDINQSNFNYIQNLARLQNTTKKNRVYGKITGHVLDESGLPLPGASIVIKGSAKGVTTDFDGFYSIDAASDDILIISYLGYKSEKITVGFRNNINTQLRQGEALGEVTVVAYAGSHGKVASAVATLTMNGQSIQQVPIGDLGEILQGMAAGVSVTTGSGTPGQSATIIIRGRSSSQDDPEPLFVIDGVPVDQNVFRNLSDKNITSLRVLKDDPAMALYGSRGAGGVVIVTTKYGTRTELIDGVEVIVGITEEDLDVVKTRKNLKETAFFYPHLRTDANGAVAVTFDVPESLTRWKFQLFAHQKDGLYEMITKNAVTQKELMVVPNMPRFLREKDTIVISTKVINLQQKATNGIASLRLFNAHTMESIDAQLHLTEKNKRFSVDAKGNTQLSWKLYIPKGIDAIQYKVIATAGNFSDGEESVLPVLKNNILITEAKPIMVKAGEEKTVTFSKLTTNTSATLQQHQLTLEYTSNPTWNTIQSLPYLLEYPYECAEQTFARLYANLIAAHILQNTPKVREVFEAWKANGTLVSDLEKNPEFKSLLISETPWIRDAISETQQKQQLATLLDPARLETLQKEMWLQLKELQTASGGFPWFAGGADNYGITLHILQTFADLAKLKIVDKKTNARRYDEIITSAYSYADQRFLMAYDKLRKAPSDAKYRQQIEYIYTRSSTPDFMKTPENVTDAMLFYLESLRKNWMLTSVSEKAMVAMSLAKLGKRKDALKILKALEASAVKSDENGMYWKEVTEGRYSHTTATEIQALLIEAFAEITKDAKIVQELQLWLLQQKQRNQWKTTKATTKAIYALLLNPKLFVSIKDNTLITIGDKKIRTKKLDATAKEAGTGYLKTAWAKDEVTNEKATISIKNKGKTIGFGAAYWQYFEALDKVTQSEASTLQVSKELYVTETINNEKTLVPISKRALNIGDKITVRLTIRNAKDVEFIHLKDMRAAGLEPIDVLSGYKWQDGVGYYQSTRDASTNFFFDRIPAGVFIIEYELRVNATGDFSNGITTIESMYAPESRSYTKGSRIQVN